jgi:hypothetical protein
MAESSAARSSGMGTIDASVVDIHPTAIDKVWVRRMCASRFVFPSFGPKWRFATQKWRPPLSGPAR